MRVRLDLRLCYLVRGVSQPTTALPRDFAWHSQTHSPWPWHGQVKTKETIKCYYLICVADNDKCQPLVGDEECILYMETEIKEKRTHFSWCCGGFTLMGSSALPH